MLQHHISALQQVFFRGLHYGSHIKDHIPLGRIFVVIVGLVLKHHEKTPRDRLLPPKCLDQTRIILLQQPDALVMLLRRLIPDFFNILCDVRFFWYHFKLHFYRRDLQIGHKGHHDIPLLSRWSQQEIDGQDLNQLHISVVCRKDDPVLDLADREIRGCPGYREQVRLRLFFLPHLPAARLFFLRCFYFFLFMPGSGKLPPELLFLPDLEFTHPLLFPEIFLLLPL